MTATTQPSPSIHYSRKTIIRAERAIRCAPFRLKLFVSMSQQSVPLFEIAQRAGLQNQYTYKPLSEIHVESEFLWLIQVGVLRREVDGQGLTDSFRVTPLGRLFIEQWQDEQLPECSAPPLGDRLRNAINRWFRLPI